MQFLVGLLLGAIIAFPAYRVHSLSPGGAFAAVFIGAIVFGLGGLSWAILLLTFFITSTALTRAFKKRKLALNEKFSKGGQRDAGQVFGNGGAATLFVMLYFFFPGALWPWLGFAAALASVNADTWATELGVLNPTQPRMITDLRKRVEKGTSGGISLWGTGAAFLGASAIGALAALLAPSVVKTSAINLWIIFSLVTISGLLGSLFDSLLGATVQAMYFCPADQKETEKHPLHTCGTPTIHTRGLKWLDNDWVNFSCGAFGVLIALAIYAGLAGIL
ncbi:MAG: DUF92 domain-containing protein [Chloroflexi bacterium]|nr:DUF92 domain-containing protein [Chloroflexota bacterium]